MFFVDSGRPPPRQTPKPKPAARTKPTPKPKPQPEAISGPVALISVGDGDTIRLTGANGQAVTVRLALYRCTRNRPRGERRTGQLGAEAPAGCWGLEVRPQTVDRYGSTDAEVYAGGRNINLEMMRLGMAYAYRQNLSGCCQATLKTEPPLGCCGVSLSE